MVNRLFQLEQELARKRQQSQQEFSAAQSADNIVNNSVYDSSPNNRLQALEQDLTGNQSAALNPIAQAQSYDTMSFEQSFDDYDPILDDEPDNGRPAMAMQLVSAKSVNNLNENWVEAYSNEPVMALGRDNPIATLPDDKQQHSQFLAKGELSADLLNALGMELGLKVFDYRVTASGNNQWIIEIRIPAKAFIAERRANQLIIYEDDELSEQTKTRPRMGIQRELVQRELAPLDLTKGFNLNLTEPLLDRFADPYGLYSKPDQSSYVFKAGTRFLGKQKLPKAKSYQDLLLLDIIVELVPNTSRKITTEQNIPNVMNFIWMGGPFTKNRGWKEVETFIDFGKIPILCLWTDVSRDEIVQVFQKKLDPAGQKFSDREQGISDMYVWCITKNICLINVDEVFNAAAPMILQPLFNLCRLHQHWGPASDIFRYELLYRFGGGYSDIDHICHKSMLPLAQFTKTVPISKKHLFSHCVNGTGDNKIPTMASFISTPENPIFGNMLQYVKGSFFKTRAQVGDLIGLSMVFKLGFETSTEVGTKEILGRTGPNAYYTSLINTLWQGKFQSQQLKKDNIEMQCDGIIKALYNNRLTYAPTYAMARGDVPLDPLYATNAKFIKECCIEDDVMLVQSGASWMGRRILKLENLQNVQVAVTVMLFDLRNNPGVLDLTFYDYNSPYLITLLKFMKETFVNDMQLNEVWILNEPNNQCIPETLRKIMNVLNMKAFSGKVDSYEAAGKEFKGYVLKP